LALLWVEIVEVYLGRESGSRFAVDLVMVPGIGCYFGAFGDV
jgi:hypothetical protein